MKSLLLPFAMVALVSSSLAGQFSKRMVPNPGPWDGSSSAIHFTVYGAGRVQQITLGSSLCNGTAVIFELAMRADGVTPFAMPARSLTRLKLSLGYTSKTPAGMSTTFATNRTGKQSLLFDGKYTLPAQNTKSRPFNIRWKFAKPYIYKRTSGNLLIEYEIPTLATTKFPYYTDAHLQVASTGFSYNFGKGGPFSARENILLYCVSNAALKPGGKADMIVQPLAKQYAALSIWGFSRDKWGPVSLPLDLTGLGAPKNVLNVSPDLIFALPVTPLVVGFHGRATLPIPADNNLNGLSIFTQAVFLDQKANQAGLVFSEGLAMNLQPGQAPAQMLGHYDHMSAAGSKTRPGEGIVFEFTGSFQ